jgi:hypothetical protein
MFDYAQLVDTACGGLLPERSSKCQQWENFIEFLRFAQSAQKISSELHDAALYALQYNITLSTSTSSEGKHISRLIDAHALGTWQLQMRELSDVDPIGMRAPWIWRGI